MQPSRSPQNSELVAPIWRLPLEVLIEILQHADDPVTLSQTCLSWRTKVLVTSLFGLPPSPPPLGIRKLWSRIFINTDRLLTPDRYTQRMKHHILHAGGEPLHFRFRGVGDSEPIRRMLTEVSRKYTQLATTIELRLPVALVRMFLSVHTNTNFQELETFMISTDKRSVYQGPIIHHVIFNAPRLRNVGFVLPMVPKGVYDIIPFSVEITACLTTLDMEQTSMEPSMYGEIMMTCAVLRYAAVRINADVVDSVNDALELCESPASRPELETLRIALSGLASSDTASPLFLNFLFPGLKELRIESDGSYIWDRDSMLHLSRHCTSLETFQLSTISTTVDELTEFLQDSPSITRLILDDMPSITGSPVSMHKLTWESSTGLSMCTPVLPNLQELNLVHSDTYSYLFLDGLVKMVVSRMAHATPLSVLRLCRLNLLLVKDGLYGTTCKLREIDELDLVPLGDMTAGRLGALGDASWSGIRRVFTAEERE